MIERSVTFEHAFVRMLTGHQAFEREICEFMVVRRKVESGPTQLFQSVNGIDRFLTDRWLTVLDL